MNNMRARTHTERRARLLCLPHIYYKCDFQPFPLGDALEKCESNVETAPAKLKAGGGRGWSRGETVAQGLLQEPDLYVQQSMGFGDKFPYICPHL